MDITFEKIKKKCFKIAKVHLIVQAKCYIYLGKQHTPDEQEARHETDLRKASGGQNRSE